MNWWNRQSAFRDGVSPTTPKAVDQPLWCALDTPEGKLGMAFGGLRVEILSLKVQIGATLIANHLEKTSKRKHFGWQARPFAATSALWREKHVGVAEGSFLYGWKLLRSCFSLGTRFLLSPRLHCSILLNFRGFRTTQRIQVAAMTVKQLLQAVSIHETINRRVYEGMAQDHASRERPSQFQSSRAISDHPFWVNSF